MGTPSQSDNTQQCGHDCHSGDRKSHHSDKHISLNHTQKQTI